MDQIMEKTEYGVVGASVIRPFEKTGEYYIESQGWVADKPVYSFIKRMFDIVTSAVVLLIQPVSMLIIGLAACCTSEGGSLFIQERLGKDGKPFLVIKFRTMKKDTECNSAQWSRGDEDERITEAGVVLRKVRLDELPQLWCIIKGDMRFVVPRPERKVFYDEFKRCRASWYIVEEAAA